MDVAVVVTSNKYGDDAWVWGVYADMATAVAAIEHEGAAVSGVDGDYTLFGPPDGARGGFWGSIVVTDVVTTVPRSA